MVTNRGNSNNLATNNPSHPKHVKHADRHVLRVLFLPHPAEHAKHVHLGVFTCSSPLSLCPSLRTREIRLGVFFMFASFLTTQTRKTRPDGVSMCCFYFDTMCPFSSCLCFNFDMARKCIPLLVVLLFRCGEEGSVPPCRFIYFQCNEEGNAPRCI
jgi:hypothetical protein